MIRMKKIIALLLVILIAGSTFAMSPNEATTFVSNTNNYLLDNEVADILQPQVMVSYNKTNYWIVVGATGGITSIYLPVSIKRTEVASGAIEIRELIKTGIVLSRAYQLKSQYTVSDWPFSHPTKTTFYDLENSFNNLIPSVTTIATTMESVSGAESLEQQAVQIKNSLEKISAESKIVAENISDGIEFEREYFTNPDTNETRLYETQFENFFSDIESYKEEYNELKSKMDLLKQDIATFEIGIDASEKEFYFKVLQMPAETISLSSLFSRTDQTKTLIEEIFNSSKNIENLVLNLETREMRNDAWKTLYGADNEITSLNPNFNSVAEAAEAILAEENVDYWKNQDSVSALQINWGQAKTKYNNAIYEKAVSFGKDAKKNVKNILKDGVADQEDNSGEIITQIMIVLAVILVAVFILEKFVLNKRKEKMDYEEENDYENDY
jgi:hypothetical protein